jgi:hypothetical protein
MKMNQNTRRILLLLVTTLTGATLVFLDGDIFLVLGTSFIVGFTMLILLGLLDISSIDPIAEARKLEANLPNGTLFRKIGEKNEDPDQKAKPDDSFREKEPVPGRFRQISAKIAGSFSFIRSFRKKRKSDKAKPEDIDALLDKTIHEPVSADEIPDFGDFDIELDGDGFGDEADVDKRISEKIESLTALDDKSFEQLESEINEKVFRETAADGLEFDLEEEGVPSIAPDAGAEMAGFGVEPVEELEGFDDLGEFDFEEEDLSLDNIDLDAVEPDVVPEELEAPLTEETPVIVEEEESPPAPPEPAAQAADPVGFGDDDVGSFGFDDDGESGIMDMLRGDSRKEASVVDLSVVRDLKDVHVDVTELEGEMKEVLETLGRNQIRRKV